MLKFLIVGIVIGGTVAFMLTFNKNNEAAGEVIMFIACDQILGPFIIAGINIVATIVFVPGVFMALFSGYASVFVFDHMWVAMAIGTLACFSGTLLGSLIAMNMGRYLIRERVERWHKKSKTLRALHRVIELKGTRILG